MEIGVRPQVRGLTPISSGDGGIRTLDTGLTPYNGLANRRLQPLGHLSRTDKSSGDSGLLTEVRSSRSSGRSRETPCRGSAPGSDLVTAMTEIGRASCRERERM